MSLARLARAVVATCVVTVGLGLGAVGQAHAAVPNSTGGPFHQLDPLILSPSRCLDVVDRSLQAGAQVQVYTCRSATDSQQTAQLFEFVQPSNPPGVPPVLLPGGFQVINKASGLCLTSFDPTGGELITQQSCTDISDSRKRWEIIAGVSGVSGAFRLRSLEWGDQACMTVEGNGDNHSPVRVEPCGAPSAAAGQEWQLR